MSNGAQHGPGKIRIPWSDLRLRPFPNVALKVLQLYQNENVQLNQISSLISSDPAFSSEVMILVNSYLFSSSQPITSIMHAVVTLGTKRLQGLCLTVGVRAFLGRHLTEPAMRMLWLHSLSTGIIAEQLAVHSGIDPDTAYTAGVLHDVGRLGMALVCSKEYFALLSSHQGSPVSMLERERQLFGMDHVAIGERLFRDWHLPNQLATGNHHTPISADEWNLNELMKVSCLLADAAGYAAFAGCETTPYEELLTLIPEKTRGQFYADLMSLRDHLSWSIKSIEAK